MLLYYTMYSIARKFIWGVRFEIALFLVLTAGLALWGFPSTYSIATLGAFFIIAVLLNSTFISLGISKGLGDVRRDYLSALLVAVVIALLAIWSVSLESIFFISAFLAFLLYAWDSRILAALALAALASCPFLLSFNQNALAEQMAVYAYFFLVMTVALQIVEYKRHPNEYAKD